MGKLADELKSKAWTHTTGSYMISTDSSLIPLSTLNGWFGSDLAPWTQAFPEDVLLECLESSLCFGLYHKQSDSTLKLIGFERLVTDYTSFAYLTDVLVDPSYQGQGLGRWLIGCARETMGTMPYLRRCMLLTGGWDKTVPFYEKELGMELMPNQKGKGLAVMECKGRGFSGYIGTLTKD